MGKGIGLSGCSFGVLVSLLSREFLVYMSVCWGLGRGKKRGLVGGELCDI